MFSFSSACITCFYNYSCHLDYLIFSLIQCLSLSLLWCSLRLRRLVVHISHLVFIDPYFIPPTHPTNGDSCMVFRPAWPAITPPSLYGRLLCPCRKSPANFDTFGYLLSSGLR